MDMDWASFLASLKIEDVALAGIVTFIIYLILLGKLSPATVVQDVRAERDAWKTAYLTEAKAGAVKDAQISELLELSRTANHALRSLPPAGGDDVSEAARPVPPSH